MSRNHRPARSRRRILGSTIAALAVLAAVVGAPTATLATDITTVAQAEAEMVRLLNEDRTSAGLVPVQVDSRLMAIARARSVDMATKHYFSHSQPDGRNVFDILNGQGIKWYNAGEIIAYNTYPIEATAGAANRQWLNSAGHRAILMSNDMNYFGVGLAIDGAKKIWTAVYIKGPDRTGAKATAKTPVIATGTTATTKKVTVNWSGADVKLQVLTSGLHSYQVQRRTDGGAWTTVTAGTTGTTLSQNLPTGHTYEFRVSARDKAGNWGAWSTVQAAVGGSMAGVTVRR